MFKDQHIAVIGASHGIGWRVAQLLSAQGAFVHAYSRTPLPELLPNATWYGLDVLQPDFELTGLPETLHGLVYCPGSINLKPFSRISSASLREELEINLVGAFTAIQRAFPALKRSGGAGSIVLFSTVAVQTGMNFHAGIAAAKGAVEGLTRSLAAEMAPTVRVNAIAPSLTDTPLAASLLNTEEKKLAAINRHPLRKIGTVDDMANAVLFLLSEQSAFITGQVLRVDGGMGNLK
jgi:NAD(P)-dependent dehydrogenase (short-subunit alcohol dehydrogenase family)